MEKVISRLGIYQEPVGSVEDNPFIGEYKLYYVGSINRNFLYESQREYLARARNVKELLEQIDKVFVKEDGWEHSILSVDSLDEGKFYYFD